MHRLLLALVLACSGCAHSMQIRSDPPGAEVFVDGEKIGTTPMTWQEPVGDEGAYDVEVRRGSQSERFTVAKTGWSVETAALVGGACIGGSFAAGVVGGILWVASLALGLPTCGASLVLAPVGFAAVLVGALGFWPAVAATGIVTWLYGRVGPDVVYVDLDGHKATTQPAGMLGPPLAPPRRPALRDEPSAPEVPAPPLY